MPATARAPALPQVAPLLGRHGGLVALLAAGAALRVLAEVAIYPGIWFSDTNTYVRVAATGTLSVQRVVGYSLVVAPFWRLGSAAAVVVCFLVARLPDRFAIAAPTARPWGPWLRS